jgi:hypothetical protein
MKRVVKSVCDRWMNNCDKKKTNNVADMTKYKPRQKYKWKRQHVNIGFIDSNITA